MEHSKVAAAAAAAAAATTIAYLVSQRTHATADLWERTLGDISRGVVVLRVSSVKAMDMNDAGCSVATGFIVDKKLGLVLTNRHVVTTGPTTADMVLLNKEEIELTPVYADPVHDFGFFRYDPAAVRHMELHEIKLAPSGARVGLEVRVVGNDAGEKISILSGTLARLDRAAPNYGSHTFNDFNTFYYSCASNTSGGSSGSPVVNSRGQAIALNAGTSTKSANSYYLPLNRPARALALLRASIRSDNHRGARLAIPRGTIGTIFKHHPFGELKRLGLTEETEAAVREALPLETGMLVVDQVIQGGTATGKLEVGDVLLTVGHADGAGGPRNGACDWCTTFLALEEVTDSAVGREVVLVVQRGGCEMEVRLSVADLHALCPTTLVEFGGCSLHALSEQQARNWDMPPGGVHVSLCGYMLSNAGVPSRAVIREINAQPTPTLQDFVREAQRLPDRARVPLRYVLPYHQHTERVAVITVDRTWFPSASCELDDVAGRWVSTKLPPPPPPPEPEPQPVDFPEVGGPEEVQAVSSSLCRVHYDIPFQIDGVVGLKYMGAGLVVDASRGLVLVDRNTVPVVLGDAIVEFACTVEVPARTLFLHPTHNFAVVQYDPSLLAGSSVRSASLSETAIAAGEECTFVGFSKQEMSAAPVYQSCVVRESTILEVGLSTIPRFRATNQEVLRFDVSLALEDTIGGVFVDEAGSVVALWSAYANCTEHDEVYEQFDGMPIEAAVPCIRALSRGESLLRAASPTKAEEEEEEGEGEGEGGEGGGEPFTAAAAEKLMRKHLPMGEKLLPTGEKPKKPKKGAKKKGGGRGGGGGNGGANGGAGGGSSGGGSGGAPRASLWFLDAELRPISLSTACGATQGAGLGLTRQWAEKLAACDPEKRQVLQAVRLAKGRAGHEGAAGAAAQAGLKEGDLILAIGGAPVTTFMAVDDCVRGSGGVVSLTILREAAEQKLQVRCPRVESDGTTHVVQWCGLIVQQAYRSVLERGFEPEVGGVYVSCERRALWA